MTVKFNSVKQGVEYPYLVGGKRWTDPEDLGGGQTNGALLNPFNIAQSFTVKMQHLFTVSFV